MFIDTPKEGFHFSSESISDIEDHYSAKYMGPWSIRDIDGNWTSIPVDVFYQPDPKKDLGHTNYFGMYRDPYGVKITKADSAFLEPIVGILTDDGEVIVSRYRHDYVSKGGYMIDGGRDYVRSNPSCQYVSVTVDEGLFKFELYGDNNE